MIALSIYSPIDSPLAREVRERLSAAPREPVTLRVHSPGGELFAALAIHAALRAHAGRVSAIVEGVAASAASIIVMAADEIAIAENGYLMIHDPSMTAAGGGDDLRSAAELVDRTREQLIGIYAARAKIDRERIAEMMQGETWLDARQAVDAGLADRITEGRRVAASWRASDHFEHPPKTLENQPMAATAQEIKAACPKAPAEFVLSQVMAEATVDEARASWLDEREKALAKRERTAPGCDGLADTGRVRNQSDGDPDEFTRLVDAEIAKGKSRIDAVATVGRRHPDLHAAFVSASNPASGRIQTLIAERFAQ